MPYTIKLTTINGGVSMLKTSLKCQLWLVITFITIIIINVINSPSLYAVVSPSQVNSQSKQPVNEVGRQLDWVKIKVGEEEHIVKKDQEYAVVEGDTFSLTGAGLVDPNEKIVSVNLVGFTPPKGSDDRNFDIASQKDLQRPFSIDGKGELYRIKVTAANKPAGEVFIRIIAPELRYAEIKVNGELQTIREGSLLKVNNKDEVSVQKVMTNVENDKEKVDFQIVPATKNPDLTGVKFFEMRFLRGGKVFARIPMQVEGT